MEYHRFKLKYLGREKLLLNRIESIISNELIDVGSFKASFKAKIFKVPIEEAKL